MNDDDRKIFTFSNMQAAYDAGMRDGLMMALKAHFGFITETQARLLAEQIMAPSANYSQTVN